MSERAYEEAEVPIVKRMRRALYLADASYDRGRSTPESVAILAVKIYDELNEAKTSGRGVVNPDRMGGELHNVTKGREISPFRFG